MNYKRRKPRRDVRCALCTPHRNGNAGRQRPVRDRRQVEAGSVFDRTAFAHPDELPRKSRFAELDFA